MKPPQNWHSGFSAESRIFIWRGCKWQSSSCTTAGRFGVKYAGHADVKDGLAS